MRLHHALYVAAIAAFLSFGVSAFAEEGSGVYTASGVVLFPASLTTWIGAIYVWTVARRSSRSSLLSLVILVPFGFVIGWLYVLARGHELVRYSAAHPKSAEQLPPIARS